ncbi:MAG: hypothetical protein F6K55_03825 [Moorea sp. SIO4A3]|nr:hypothetical protein [Moorena sp. SIO4A3]
MGKELGINIMAIFLEPRTDADENLPVLDAMDLLQLLPPEEHAGMLLLSIPIERKKNVDGQPTAQTKNVDLAESVGKVAAVVNVNGKKYQTREYLYMNSLEQQLLQRLQAFLICFGRPRFSIIYRVMKNVDVLMDVLKNVDA